MIRIGLLFLFFFFFFGGGGGYYGIVIQGPSGKIISNYSDPTFPGHDPFRPLPQDFL